MAWRPGDNFHFDKGFLCPFACFTCRKSFKRAARPGDVERKCPHCGGTAVRLDRKFKPPAQDDVKQWEKVRRLYSAGIDFYRGPLPQRLADVDGFLAAREAAAEARREAERLARKKRAKRKRVARRR
jgi:hypothetical protein